MFKRKRVVRVLSAFVLVGLAVMLLVPFNIQVIEGQSQEELEDELGKLRDEIDAIQQEKNKLQSQIDSDSYTLQGYSNQAAQLYGEIQIFQKEIEILEKEVAELDLNIKLLEEKIAENQKEIEKSEKTISELEVESTKRIKENYKSFRLTGGATVDTSSIFNTDSINEFFKDSQYLAIIQDDTNRMLTELASLKAELESKKKDLDKAKLDLQQEQEAIKIKRDDLTKKHDELAVQQAIYYAEINAIQNEIAQKEGAIAAFSEEEIRKKAEADLVQQQILNAFIPTDQGQYVTAGRIIGQQGCTGLCTGAHLHFSVQVNGGWQDPCGYLKGGGPVAGCGWGSQLDWPIRGTVYYTSAFGNRCFMWGSTYYCDFHTGADFAGVPWNTAVYSAHDGYLYKGVDPYGANYVIICQNANCNVGFKTGYWHLSAF